MIKPPLIDWRLVDFTEPVFILKSLAILILFIAMFLSVVAVAMLFVHIGLWIVDLDL
jgi:hypothetical protein